MRIISIDLVNHIITVTDINGHTNDIAFGDVKSDNISFVSVSCPVAGCGVVGNFPISGGSDRANIQKLFVWLLQNRQAGRTNAQAITLGKTLSSQLGGTVWEGS